MKGPAEGSGADAPPEPGGRKRASMILWLVVAAAVAVGVTLYFTFGSAIIPLLGPEP